MSSCNFFFELNFSLSHYYSYPLLFHSPPLLKLHYTFPTKHFTPFTPPSLSLITPIVFFLPPLLTTEFLQRLFRVRFPVAALPDVVGLQLHHGLHARQQASTCFQVHLGKQLPASSSGLIVHSLVPTLETQRTWMREFK